jgi:DNA repair protein RadC
MTKETKEPETQQPEPDYIGHRQRLKARFVSDLGRSMPDYELLELLLTYALPRRDVKPLAKELIRHYLNLANVLVAPPDELMNLKGVGSSAAVLLAAVHACAKKITWENLENRDVPIFTDKKMIAEFCRSSIGHAGQEQLLVIYMDIKGNYLRDEIEQVGTIGAVMINPRDIVQKALMYKASRIIISHNHPTGDCTPSKADIEMTKELQSALKTVKMRLEDHIIISPRESFSMRDHFPFMNIF